MTLRQAESKPGDFSSFHQKPQPAKTGAGKAKTGAGVKSLHSPFYGSAEASASNLFDCTNSHSQAESPNG
jgi:hypothetical protein